MSDLSRGGKSLTSSSSGVPTSSDVVIKEGWLTKQGGVIKNWKQRWFVLYDNNRLCYYKTSYDKAPIDTIQLSNMVQVPQIKSGTHIIELSIEGRVYQLQAPTADEANEWLALLAQRATPLARKNSMINPPTPNNNNNNNRLSSPVLSSSSNNIRPLTTQQQSMNVFDVKGCWCKQCEENISKVMEGIPGLKNYEIISNEDKLVIDGLNIDSSSVITQLELRGFIVFKTVL